LPDPWGTKTITMVIHTTYYSKWDDPQHQKYPASPSWWEEIASQ